MRKLPVFLGLGGVTVVGGVGALAWWIVRRRRSPSQGPFVTAAQKSVSSYSAPEAEEGGDEGALPGPPEAPGGAGGGGDGIPPGAPTEGGEGGGEGDGGESEGGSTGGGGASGGGGGGSPAGPSDVDLDAAAGEADAARVAAEKFRVTLMPRTKGAIKVTGDYLLGCDAIVEVWGVA